MSGKLVIFTKSINQTGRTQIRYGRVDSDLPLSRESVNNYVNNF